MFLFKISVRLWIIFDSIFWQDNEEADPVKEQHVQVQDEAVFENPWEMPGFENWQLASKHNNFNYQGYISFNVLKLKGIADADAETNFVKS